MWENAIGVIWPIKVLKAKLIIVAIETPLDLVRVSNTSAGTICKEDQYVLQAIDEHARQVAMLGVLLVPNLPRKVVRSPMRS
jgi:hypothetical protein